MRELLVLYLQLFCMYKLVQIKKVLMIKMQEKKERTQDCAFMSLKLCRSLPLPQQDLTLKALDGSRAMPSPLASGNDALSPSLGFSSCGPLSTRRRDDCTHSSPPSSAACHRPTVGPTPSHPRCLHISVVSSQRASLTPVPQLALLFTCCSLWQKPFIFFRVLSHSW